MLCQEFKLFLGSHPKSQKTAVQSEFQLTRDIKGNRKSPKIYKKIEGDKKSMN